MRRETSRSLMGKGRALRLIICGAACCFIGGLLPGKAEIITRELGENSRGEKVRGYVFQSGRSYQQRSRRSNSVFRGRRDYGSRGRGIDYGYSYPRYAPSFYYYVPRHYSYPLHRYHHGGGNLSVYVRF